MVVNAVKCPTCKEWVHEDEIQNENCFKCSEDNQTDLIWEQVYLDFQRVYLDFLESCDYNFEDRGEDDFEDDWKDWIGSDYGCYEDDL